MVTNVNNFETSSSFVYQLLLPLMYILKIAGYFPGPVTRRQLSPLCQTCLFLINYVWYIANIALQITSFGLAVIPQYLNLFHLTYEHHLLHDFIVVIFASLALVGLDLIFQINAVWVSSSVIKQIYLLDRLACKGHFKRDVIIASVFFALAFTIDFLVGGVLINLFWLSPAQESFYVTNILKYYGGSPRIWGQLTRSMWHPLWVKNFAAGYLWQIFTLILLYVVTRAFDQFTREFKQAVLLIQLPITKIQIKKIKRCLKNHMKLRRIMKELDRLFAPTIVILFLFVLVYMTMLIDMLGLALMGLDHGTMLNFRAVIVLISQGSILGIITVTSANLHVKAVKIEKRLQACVEMNSIGATKTLFLAHLVRVKSSFIGISFGGVIAVKWEFVITDLSYQEFHPANALLRPWIANMEAIMINLAREKFNHNLTGNSCQHTISRSNAPVYQD